MLSIKFIIIQDLGCLNKNGKNAIYFVNLLNITFLFPYKIKNKIFFVFLNGLIFESVYEIEILLREIR